MPEPEGVVAGAAGVLSADTLRETGVSSHPRETWQRHQGVGP